MRRNKVFDGVDDTLDLPDLRRNYAFPIGSALTAFGAVAIVYLTAPEAMPALRDDLVSYGRLLFLAVLTLAVVHLYVMVFLRKARSKAGCETERRAWHASYFRQMPLLDMVVATAALALTSTSFTVHKAAVIGADGYGFDATFIAWDRAIFGGTDPWVYTHWLFSSATATQWIDFIYFPGFMPMFLGYLLCIIARRAAPLRHTYMLSYLLGCLIVGMLAANAMHSAGPVFDGVLFGDGTTFSPLMERLHAQQAAGGGAPTAEAIRQYLTEAYFSAGIELGSGISAMPSMHIVLAALWVFPAWHINKYLGALMTVYGIIIWIGSVHLGWHYFVDGLIALAMIGAIWVAVGFALGLYGRAQVIRATT